VHSSASDAADARRSVRHYAPEAIPESELREILRLVGRAPSAWNLQPWRFVVVQDPALKTQLMAVANNQPQVGRAPAVFVIYSDLDDVLAHLDEVAPPGKTPEQVAAWEANIRRYFDSLAPATRLAWANGQAFIALGWLLLIAQSRGYVTSPMLGFNAEGVKQLLGLPPGATVTALMALGRNPEEEQQQQGLRRERHPVDRVATFR
jgi:nitroreductase